MILKYSELSERQQAKARARFIDAGSPRDTFWYELATTGHILCRNREHPEPGDIEDEGIIT